MTALAPQSSAKTRARRTTAVIAAALFAGTLLLFARSIPHEFVNYDDPRYVTANPFIQSPGSGESLRWAFGGHLELWQPLTWLSHMLDWAMYGAHAWAHHLTSVLWHSLNAALAFLALQRLTRARWLSAFTAALYAWHPLRVESVAWVAERKDVTSGAFFFLTLWCYLGYAEARQSGTRPIGRYLATLACFVAGLMCKPTLVTLPLLLLALDAWPLRRLSLGATTSETPANVARAGRTRAIMVWAEKAPFFFASATVGLLTIRLQHAGGQFTLPLPWLARLENVPVAFARYVGKTVWPAVLTVAYPHPGWWPLPVVAGASLLGLGVAIAAWRMRRTFPWLALGLTWFVLLLLPTIGILQVGFQSMADRYTYLPTVGLWLAVVWTVHACLATWPRRARAALAAAILLPIAARTWAQQNVWRDSLTLFRHAVAASNSSAIAEAFLGYTLASTGRGDEAVAHSQRALALDPRNEMAVYTLAQAAANAGRVEEAIRFYRRDLELQPDNAATEYELALQLLRHGDASEAADLLAAAARRAPELIAHNAELAHDAAERGELAVAALRLDAAMLMQPDNADTQLAAAVAFATVHRDADARRAFARAIALRPDFADAHAEFGVFLLNRREVGSAGPELARAIQLAPKLVPALVGLARLEDLRGERAEADAHFAQALAEAPRNPDVARAWADTLARRGQFGEAVAFYRRALDTRPNDAETNAGLGYALLLSGDRSGASAAWQRALELDPNFPGLRARLERLQR